MKKVIFILVCLSVSFQSLAANCSATGPNVIEVSDITNSPTYFPLIGDSYTSSKLNNKTILFKNASGSMTLPHGKSILIENAENVCVLGSGLTKFKINGKVKFTEASSAVVKVQGTGSINLSNLEITNNHVLGNDSDAHSRALFAEGWGTEGHTFILDNVTLTGKGNQSLHVETVSNFSMINSSVYCNYFCLSIQNSGFSVDNAFIYIDFPQYRSPLRDMHAAMQVVNTVAGENNMRLGSVKNTSFYFKTGNSVIQPGSVGYDGMYTVDMQNVKLYGSVAGWLAYAISDTDNNALTHDDKKRFKNLRVNIKQGSGPVYNHHMMFRRGNIIPASSAFTSLPLISKVAYFSDWGIVTPSHILLADSTKPFFNAASVLPVAATFDKINEELTVCDEGGYVCYIGYMKTTQCTQYFPGALNDPDFTQAPTLPSLCQ